MGYMMHMLMSLLLVVVFDDINGHALHASVDNATVSQVNNKHKPKELLVTRVTENQQTVNVDAMKNRTNLGQVSNYNKKRHISVNESSNSNAELQEILTSKTDNTSLAFGTHAFEENIENKEGIQHSSIEVFSKAEDNLAHPVDQQKEQNYKSATLGLHKPYQFIPRKNKTFAHTGFPKTDRTIITSTSLSNRCYIQPMGESVRKFKHFAYYKDLSYVYLDLKPKENVTINGVQNVVGKNIWVWTYFGNQGGLEFLKWPIEFGIWSMGLLNSYTFGPLDIYIERLSGDCTNLTVGDIASDLIISEALVNLTEAMLPFGENRFGENRYGPSFWCYKRRMFINPPFLYVLCKHIVCPIESLKYECCAYVYNTTKAGREVKCRHEQFEYDIVWWIGPIIIAVLLFAFFPLPLMHFAWLLSLKSSKISHNSNYNRKGSHIQCNTTDKVVFYDENNNVTLLNTLFLPFDKCFSKLQPKWSRIIRFFFPFISLSIIGLQVLLDYCYLYHFVLTSIDSGVPLGFRSMISGYRKSAPNFLPYFGGPYIALAIYLLLTCVFMTIPSSLADLLETGLTDFSFDESKSPLRLGLRYTELFGSVHMRHSHRYLKLYNVYLGQFYMILNAKFWKHVICAQVERGKQFCIPILRFIILPVYTIVCFIELVLSLALYGLPIVSFGLTVIRAYCGSLKRSHAPNCIWKCNIIICQFFLVICVVYFLFMFGTIFLDATLFFSRVIIFTYTGIVVYPKESYGYLIFSFTSIYYLLDCFQNFSLIYKRLLKDTIKVCGHIQRANDTTKVVVSKGGVKGVKEVLFEHVIESLHPRRKQCFISVLKLTTILGILGLSINLLIKTDKFRELHVIMHVGTALFICALPNLVKALCMKSHYDKFQHKRLLRDIESAVKDYLGYFIETKETDSE